MKICFREVGLSFVWPALSVCVLEITPAQTFPKSERSDDYALASVVDRAGDVIVTGVSGSDVLTFKYSSTDGTVLWEHRATSPSSLGLRPAAVALDSKNNVFITGFSQNGPSGLVQFNTDGDFYTAKYAAQDGALIWEKFYNGSANFYDAAAALAVDGNDDAVVTGVSLQAEGLDLSNNIDYYTIKYAGADGAVIWEQRYDNERAGWDQPFAMALDGAGNILISGVSGSESGSKYSILKYAATGGSPIWIKRYGTIRNGYARSALAVDKAGNVIVTGYSGSGSTGDYSLVKYAGVDGALLWEHHCRPGDSNYQRGDLVTLDRSGNVFVAGSSGNYHVTAKYNATDGTLLWKRLQSGRAEHTGHPNSLAMHNDDPVVAGALHDYLVRYSGSDGQLLWERYSGRIHESPTALALDTAGNVFSTGAFYNGTDLDYYTVKHANASGDVVWATANAAAYRQEISISSPPLISGFRLSFSGTAGQSYSIERASQLSGPWTTIHAQSLTASGVLEFDDLNPPLDRAFYRTRTP